MPFAYPLIATLLLTGGRPAEVLGLEIDDVNPKRRTVTFRRNQWRRLKTARSARTVQLWPQLEEILRAYLPQRMRMPDMSDGRTDGKLLFPSFRRDNPRC
jgi:integrase